MGIIDKTLEIVTSRRLKSFDKATADPAAAQEKVFADLVYRAARTDWGRKWGYSEIRSFDDFRKRVPLTDYESMAPIWQRAFTGERDVAWPGHVRFFALSSGTTSGDKLLPVTREAIKSNKRSGADLVAFMVRTAGARALTSGRFFYLGGTTTLRERGKSLFGDASGIMSRHIPFYAKRHHLPDAQTGALSNWEDKIARVVSMYLTADISALSACPSWAAMLFKEMLAEAARRGLPQKTIGDLWPKLAFFVSYGMNFAPYVNSYDRYIGRRVRYIDTYSSSEGGMNAIQDEENGPMRLIVDNGVFFEFIPAEKAADPEPPRLHIGEVETGKDYALALNTNGGIWAYPIGDVIRFESLSPPRITFTGRTQIMLSAFGEHVTLEQMDAAVAKACNSTRALVADYTVWPVYPAPDHPKPAHRWIFEFDAEPSDEGEFMSAIDRSIRSVNEDYDTHRTDDFGMTPPELVKVPSRTFFEWMKLKGKLGGQHKVPRVTIKQNMGEEIMEIARRIAEALMSRE